MVSHFSCHMLYYLLRPLAQPAECRHVTRSCPDKSRWQSLTNRKVWQHEHTFTHKTTFFTDYLSSCGAKETGCMLTLDCNGLVSLCRVSVCVCVCVCVCGGGDSTEPESWYEQTCIPTCDVWGGDNRQKYSTSKYSSISVSEASYYPQSIISPFFISFDWELNVCQGICVCTKSHLKRNALKLKKKEAEQIHDPSEVLHSNKASDLGSNREETHAN